VYLKFPIESEFKDMENIVCEAVDEAIDEAYLILHNSTEEE